MFWMYFALYMYLFGIVVVFYLMIHEEQMCWGSGQSKPPRVFFFCRHVDLISCEYSVPGEWAIMKGKLVVYVVECMKTTVCTHGRQNTNVWSEPQNVCSFYFFPCVTRKEVFLWVMRVFLFRNPKLLRVLMILVPDSCWRNLWPGTMQRINL